MHACMHARMHAQVETGVWPYRARLNTLAGHNLIIDPYIYIGSIFLVARHSKHLTGTARPVGLAIDVVEK